RRLGVEGMGRSYRPAAYLGLGRVYFHIAASDAPEPLSPSRSARLVLSTWATHQKAPRPTWLLARGCLDSLFQHACAAGDLRHDRRNCTARFIERANARGRGSSP